MRPLPIAWTCGVVPEHEHATEAEAQACINRRTVASPLGWCPVPGCEKRGASRERRPGGNDTCEAGHQYASVDALPGEGR